MREWRLGSGFDADVIVVGAGFTGLTAARGLGGREVTVIVPEARDRVCGFILCQEVPAAGRGVELGGACFDPSKLHDVRIEAVRYGKSFDLTEADIHML